MRRPHLVWLPLAALLLLLPAGPAVAQSGDGYDLTWWTVDGGGGMDHSVQGYALGGTISQPDAALLSGEDGYTLLGGFWGAGYLPAAYGVYLPLLVKAYRP